VATWITANQTPRSDLTRFPFFHDPDEQRVNRVVDIQSALNTDIFVWQEIRDKSLEVVAEKLTKAGAGNYEVNYGTTGRRQVDTIVRYRILSTQTKEGWPVCLSGTHLELSTMG